ncbi:hypothetical protein COUCH_26530 [Couchioplanes caeruleus]|uniref:hypothetical protein n=1 Tax=Couchioplanes caeruleus TaxID=56438 RepID=UPI0020BE1AB4|nr:hypothetical protein [Couchioplanes caeruleus]UQU62573.1 hypothetical protein COUCH_26530 [Couchioplanes caeruleus]
MDGPGLYPSLTARQNLAALAALRGLDADAAIDDVLGEVSSHRMDDVELDYRLITSDRREARRVAAETTGVVLVDGAGTREEVLVVRTVVPVLDELVARLVRSGVAIRELTPVVSPLEAAFLALTEQPAATR